VPLIVLVVSLIIFGSRPELLQAGTLSTILQQIAIVGILGCAQSIVILTAGIDLSVGAIAVFSSVMMGQIHLPLRHPRAGDRHRPGARHRDGGGQRLLIARMKLPPFIVTLGTWQIILASNFIYSANETIRSQDIEAQAPLPSCCSSGADDPAGSRHGQGSLCVFLMIALVPSWPTCCATPPGAGMSMPSATTRGGRTGGRAGQPHADPGLCLAGLLCAIAGWVMIGRFGSVSPTASTGVLGNIQSITAVVIGGISLFGGRGSIVGMFFGALIVGVFEMGLRLLGTDPQWTFFLIGALIIGAVAVDQWIRKVSS
jgi:fructose transport system permease protein